MKTEQEKKEARMAAIREVRMACAAMDTMLSKVQTLEREFPSLATVNYADVFNELMRLEQFSAKLRDML